MDAAERPLEGPAIMCVVVSAFEVWRQWPIVRERPKRGTGDRRPRPPLFGTPYGSASLTTMFPDDGLNGGVARTNAAQSFAWTPGLSTKP